MDFNFPAAPTRAVQPAHPQGQQQKPQQMAPSSPQSCMPGPHFSSQDMIRFQREQLRLHQLPRLSQLQTIAQYVYQQDVSPAHYHHPPSANLPQARSEPTAEVYRAWDTSRQTLGALPQLPPKPYQQQSMSPLGIVQMLRQNQQPHTQPLHMCQIAPGQDVTNSEIPSPNPEPAVMTAAQFRDSMMAQKVRQEREQLSKTINGSSPQYNSLQPRPDSQHTLPQAPLNHKRQTSQLAEQQGSHPPAHTSEFESQLPTVDNAEHLFANNQIRPQIQEDLHQLDLAEDDLCQSLQGIDSPMLTNEDTSRRAAQASTPHTLTQTTENYQPSQLAASNGALAQHNNGQLQTMHSTLVREQGYSKRIEELEAALQAMTQERDAALTVKGNSHPLVPLNFSPTAGQSYRFGKNGKGNDCWTCLHLLGYNGLPCNRVNNIWIKMRIPGGGIPVWSERTKCGACYTMKPNPSQLNESRGRVLLPSPPDSSKGSPPNWDLWGGGSGNATPTPFATGAAQHKREYLRQLAANSQMISASGTDVQTTGGISPPFTGHIQSSAKDTTSQFPSMQFSASPMNGCQLPNIYGNIQGLQQHPSSGTVAAAQMILSRQSLEVPQHLQSFNAAGQLGQAVLTSENDTPPIFPRGNMLFMSSLMSQSLSAPGGPSTMELFPTQTGGSADSPVLIEDEETAPPPAVAAGIVAAESVPTTSQSTTSQPDTSILPAFAASQATPYEARPSVFTADYAANPPQMPKIASSIDIPLSQASDIGLATASSSVLEKSDSGVNSDCTPGIDTIQSTVSKILSQQAQACGTLSAQPNKRSATQEENTTCAKRQKILSSHATLSEEVFIKERAPIKPKKDLGSMKAVAGKGHLRKITSSARRAWMDFPTEASQAQQTPFLQESSKKGKTKEPHTGIGKPESASKTTTSPSLGNCPSKPDSVLAMEMEAGLDAQVFEKEKTPNATASIDPITPYENVDVDNMDGSEVDYLNIFGGGPNDARNTNLNGSGLFVDMLVQGTPDAAHATVELVHTLRKMKLPELKNELKILRLKCVGNKDDLIKRLIDHGFTIGNSAATFEKVQKSATVEDEDFDFDAFLTENVERHLADEAAQKEQVVHAERQWAEEGAEVHPATGIEWDEESVEDPDEGSEVAAMETIHSKILGKRQREDNPVFEHYKREESSAKRAKLRVDYESSNDSEDEEHSVRHIQGDIFSGYFNDEQLEMNASESEESEED